MPEEIGSIYSEENYRSKSSTCVYFGKSNMEIKTFGVYFYLQLQMLKGLIRRYSDSQRTATSPAPLVLVS